jgi:hypothetical protein
MQYKILLGPIKTTYGDLNEGDAIDLPEDQAQPWIKAGILQAIEPALTEAVVEVVTVKAQPEATPAIEESITPTPEPTRKRGR